jgi:hypothetical protein
MRAALVALVAVAAASWPAWLAAVPAVAAGPPSGPALWAAAATYRAGAVICHQQDVRSLHVSGVRMPVCARCFGLYAGGGLGAVVAAGWVFATSRPGRRPAAMGLSSMRRAALGSAVPTLLAWGAEHLVGVPVAEVPRALAAVPLGAAVAAIVTLWAGGAPFEDGPPASAVH